MTPFAAFPKGSDWSKNSLTAGSMGLLRANQANHLPVLHVGLHLEDNHREFLLFQGFQFLLDLSSVVLGASIFHWCRMFEKAWSRCCPSSISSAPGFSRDVPLLGLDISGTCGEDDGGHGPVVCVGEEFLDAAQVLGGDGSVGIGEEG